MYEWLKDFGIPLVTFAIGLGVENCRQTKSIKGDAIKDIEAKFRELIDLSQSEPRNIPRLKYDYNTLFRLIKSFCDSYHFDFCYFNENLRELNILTTNRENLTEIQAEKLSEISIMITNKIKDI
ncbi:hypothetical protein [Actinobacillus equuli]|uniref:hypothetical protein n=1 Tax=Actinobacillus equuli TaxID=718 RepID=UPI002441A237|nr:hypothetical protein [Actinobacillus equuli]WGE53759.1 hypothetical protein NYR69_04150 [Actinobacillus equuli subsp. haemolyticus]WGE74196.1 hypothetical protein NYR80_04140 [Actinobacillus equuli subsp. haemolyticus]